MLQGICKKLSLIFFVLLMLGACGQKGPLILPEADSLSSPVRLAD